MRFLESTPEPPGRRLLGPEECYPSSWFKVLPELLVAQSLIGASFGSPGSASGSIGASFGLRGSASSLIGASFGLRGSASSSMSASFGSIRSTSCLEDVDEGVKSAVCRVTTAARFSQEGVLEGREAELCLNDGFLTS